MTLAELAAVVVNYEAGDHLYVTVSSLLASGIGEIVVVDNGSSDGSLSGIRVELESVRVVDAGHNLGYGAAVNLGVTWLGPAVSMVLVCNADLEVDPDAPRRLAQRLREERGLGIVGPRLLASDGSVYPSARAFPSLVDAIGHGLIGLFSASNPFSRRYLRTDGTPEQMGSPQWVSGACFLVRRLAFESVRGFDPAYFMFAEDVDLCWRLNRAGWEVGYEPSAVVTHHEGVSRAHHPVRMLVAHHRSLWRFACTSTSGWRRVALPIVAVGLVMRLAVMLVRLQ